MFFNQLISTAADHFMKVLLNCRQDIRSPSTFKDGFQSIQQMTIRSVARDALMVARALSIRNAKAQTEESADLDALDQAVIELEREAKRLSEIRKWTETIKSNSGKVLSEVDKMSEGVQKQVDNLQRTATALRSLRRV
jgi:hypothetical protein